MAIMLIKLSIGQDNSISIGVLGGQNYSTMRGTPFFDEFHESKTGFLGGLYISYNFGNFLNFRTELLYELKGSSSAIYQLNDIDGYPMGTYGGDFHYEYISVPMLFNPIYGNNLKVFANIGPYFSYLYRQEDVASSIVISKIPPIYPAKLFDIGLISGLGFLIPLNQNVSISIEGRNSLGLIDIGDIPERYDHGAIKNNSFGVIGSLLYTFGKN